MEDLPFAEGQNVLAIRSENAVGVQANQVLNITLNTIPLLPSDFFPLPNSFIKDNKPTIRVGFGKASYSGFPIENIEIALAKILFSDGTEKEITHDPNFKVTLSGESYDRHAAIEYTPDAPFTDGKYSILIVAKSNVGAAQALWPFTIDTTPPGVKIEPLSPVSFKGAQ